MSIFNFLSNYAKAMNDCPLKDPGASGTISVRQSGMLHLRSAAAESRTLPRPGGKGTILLIDMETDGGDITLTVTGGFNENGDTTFVFSDPGQFLYLVSTYQSASNTYQWRKISDHLVAGGGTLLTEAGVGITAGTGTVYTNSVERQGDIIKTSIFIDLTGLGSSTTDLDVIGVAGGPAHLGQITTAQNGVIDSVRMTCLELPATGVTDIDLYSATVGTAVFDDGIAALTETAVITAGGAWANGTVKGATIVPPPNDYLYLTCGAAGVPGTYTAGKFLIELFGHAA